MKTNFDPKLRVKYAPTCLNPAGKSPDQIISLNFAGNVKY